MLPKMSAYRRDFGETKYMFFFVRNDELLVKYNEIWDKVSNTLKKAFDNEPVYNEKYIRTKINLMKEKLAQIFMIIKCQIKTLSAFAYQ